MLNLTQYLFDKFVEAKDDLGANDVFFGDQDRIPRANTICVEPDEKQQELNGVPRRIAVDVRIYVLVYHNEVRSGQANLADSLSLAEAVEDLVHQDPQLGGLCIHSMVEASKAGYARKQNGLMRATRITLKISSQVQLPQSP